MRIWSTSDDKDQNGEDKTFGQSIPKMGFLVGCSWYTQVFQRRTSASNDRVMGIVGSLMCMGTNGTHLVWSHREGTILWNNVIIERSLNTQFIPAWHLCGLFVDTNHLPNDCCRPSTPPQWYSLLAVASFSRIMHPVNLQTLSKNDLRNTTKSWQLSFRYVCTCVCIHILLCSCSALPTIQLSLFTEGLAVPLKQTPCWVLRVFTC